MQCESCHITFCFVRFSLIASAIFPVLQIPLLRLNNRYTCANGVWGRICSQLPRWASGIRRKARRSSPYWCKWNRCIPLSLRLFSGILDQRPLHFEFSDLTRFCSCMTNAKRTRFLLSFRISCRCFATLMRQWWTACIDSSLVKLLRKPTENMDCFSKHMKLSCWLYVCSQEVVYCTLLWRCTCDFRRFVRL